MTHTGQARAHGAVTVVNAIPTGQGAAFGVELATEANVQVTTQEGPVILSVQAPDQAPGQTDASLAEACLSVVGEHLGTQLSGTVETTSEIPLARGLKSSSVAANAIVLALLDALVPDQPVDPETVLALSLAAARQAGVTVTGALDDAAASLLGGLVLTDNQEDVVQERKPIQEDLVVLLLVPPSRRFTQGTASALQPAAEITGRCLALTRDGHWDQGLTLNGLAVATCLGQGTGATYRALQAGALAAGTTGTGPATAAVCTPETARAVRSTWDRYEADILATHPTNDGMVMAR